MWQADEAVFLKMNTEREGRVVGTVSINHRIERGRICVHAYASFAFSRYGLWSMDTPLFPDLNQPATAVARAACSLWPMARA